MTTESCITHLECSQCKTHFDHQKVQTFCPTCTKPLLVRYDLQRAAALLNKEDLTAREPTLWRYKELLPMLDTEKIVTLGEGMTPLIPMTKLSDTIGSKQVMVKDESWLPTASFKARGLAMAVSRVQELGVKKLAIPTAGNAGGALAAYAARAGLESHIFMPKDVPRINYMEAKIAGANVTLVDGLISDCGRMVAERKDEQGWFDVSTLKEPYRIEGKKTMGLELAEQMSWELPDVIFYPTGGGTGLIGMWKAFAELQEMGWISDHLPRMISVQSTGCDPITRAFKAGKFESEFFEDAATLAAGLRVPKAFGDTLVLRALHESGGMAVSVTDDEMLAGMTTLAQQEGLLVCPEGAATWAALKNLRAAGEISGNDRVVLFNTGSGLKYPHILEQLCSA